MDGRPELEVFESRYLSSRIDWASEFSEVASGLLAIRISHVRQSYLMWFRPEVVRTVQWAGEPGKVQENQRLNPRKSFEIWSELVRGRSRPWTEVEVESATEFRGAIMTISLKRAEEAVQLGEARFLQLTNALPHPVWTADDDGQLTYVNQKWLEQGFAARAVGTNRNAWRQKTNTAPAIFGSTASQKGFPLSWRYDFTRQPMVLTDGTWFVPSHTFAPMGRERAGQAPAPT